MTAEKALKPQNNEIRIMSLEKDIHGINNAIHRIEGSLGVMNASIEKRFDKIDSKFDKIDAKFESMQAESKVHLKYTITSIVGLYAILLSFAGGIIIKLVHG